MRFIFIKNLLTGLKQDIILVCFSGLEFYSSVNHNLDKSSF